MARSRGKVKISKGRGSQGKGRGRDTLPPSMQKIISKKNNREGERTQLIRVGVLKPPRKNHWLSLKSAMKSNLNRKDKLSPKLRLLHPRTPPVLGVSPMQAQQPLIPTMPLMMAMGQGCKG